MTENNPIISIIVNCYNGAEYLEETLQSAKNQSFQDFEVIFWDNHSSDRSKSIFNGIKDKRFSYYLSPAHTKLYKARNLALEKANGKYICFLDTDDMMSKDRLKKQIHIFQNYPDIGVVYSNQIIFNNYTKKKFNFINKFNAQITESEKILQRNGATILNSLIKKEELIKLGKIFDDKYNIVGDLDLFFRLSKICKFKYLDESLVTYRLHKNNYSKKNRGEEILELDNWIENGDKNGLLNFSEKKIIILTANVRKVVNHIENKNYLIALKKIFQLPNNFIKLKLFLSLFVPQKIYFKLINY